MFGIELNNAIVRTCLRILKFVPGMQADARKRLVDELQRICSKCDDAYSAVIGRLAPVKASYGKKKALVEELRGFASDAATRAAFKPEHLCGEIDQLIQELKNNLAPLKYSLRLAGLETLEDVLRRMGNYDGQLFRQYDEFRTELEQLATELGRSKGEDQKLWQQYIEALVSDTESQLRASVVQMRSAKDEIVKIAF